MQTFIDGNNIDRGVGRFSTGIEQLPDALGQRRMGRFSTGLEQLPGPGLGRPTGRFSTGSERRVQAASSRLVGSYATPTSTPLCERASSSPSQGSTAAVDPARRLATFDSSEVSSIATVVAAPEGTSMTDASESQLFSSHDHAPLPSARSSPLSAADPQPLVVGFDGSLPAIAALAWAAGTGLPVIVVRVLDPSPTPPGADEPDRHHDVNAASLVLGDHAPVAAHRLADCAWRAELVEARSPAAGLVASARRHGATAIVVGAGARGPRRSVMGNQLHALLIDADAPVVVVPTRAAAHLLSRIGRLRTSSFRGTVSPRGLPPDRLPGQRGNSETRSPPGGGRRAGAATASRVAGRASPSSRLGSAHRFAPAGALDLPEGPFEPSFERQRRSAVGVGELALDKRALTLRQIAAGASRMVGRPPPSGTKP